MKLLFLILFPLFTYSQNFFSGFDQPDTCGEQLARCRTNAVTYLKVIDLYKGMGESKDRRIFDLQQENRAKDTAYAKQGRLMELRQSSYTSGLNHITWVKTERDGLVVGIVAYLIYNAIRK